MMMHSAFMLFASLGIGYTLCVLAKKEKGNLRTLGFSLGISIIVLSLMYGLVGTYGKGCFMMGKKGTFYPTFSKSMCPSHRR